MVRHLLQEVRELGLRGTAFRVGWELRTRTGLAGRFVPEPREVDLGSMAELPGRLPFADPREVRRWADRRLCPATIEVLVERAMAAERGLVQCFGRWVADFGTPVDWHRSPATGRRWPEHAHWARALGSGDGNGDVKLTWEVARFPHAYHMARAAAFRPGLGERLAQALLGQIKSFVARNPPGRGIHWSSGQEVAFRLLAWLFGLSTLLGRESATSEEASTRIATALRLGAWYVRANIDYARLAVHNNHLLSEALLLYAAGVLLPRAPEATKWCALGRSLLEEQTDRQFYPDGGYIQQSHNYHRLALQVLLWACVVSKAEGREPAPQWLRALGRSVDFLTAFQSPADGRLPNYGANDGALPSILSTCEFSDFRPELQAASLMGRGVRVYGPGPWDEAACWLLGPESLRAPLESPGLVSRSFGYSGHHVLRGRDDGTFAALRCGTIRDRFSQIDMLHLDVWWRGQNVLVDGGSYLYNGPREWHEHFFRTASHNTVTIDGRDQMVHARRFKTLHWTHAELLAWEVGPGHALVSGEHHGYERHPGRCVHRRSVLAGEGLWVVVDCIRGEGEHSIRLHWLCGPYAWSVDGEAVVLDTPAGPFGIAVHDAAGAALVPSVVAGSESPRRGWLSRHYGEKVAVPSIAAEGSGRLPLTLVSVLGGCGAPRLRVGKRGFTATSRDASVSFRILDGLIRVLDTRATL